MTRNVFAILKCQPTHQEMELAEEVALSPVSNRRMMTLRSKQKFITNLYKIFRMSSINNVKIKMEVELDKLKMTVHSRGKKSLKVHWNLRNH